MIVVSIPTLPERVALLEQTIETLLPQVDRLNVYLNGHEIVPSFLDHSKIVIAHSKDHGDHGAAGKFFWQDFEGYHFGCDDDILYPADYVDNMVVAIEKYKRRAIVGVLGVRFHDALLKSYYRSRIAYPIRMPLPQNVRVHAVGTGTMAYHTDGFRLSEKDFPQKWMADAWVAIKAKRERVPIYAIARPRSWLVALPIEGFSIYGQYRETGDDSKQTEILNAEAPWEPLPPLSPAARRAIQNFYHDASCRRL